MPDPQLLEFSVQSLTADKLEIKVKNISGAVLNQTVSIEIYPPSFLVTKAVNDKAVAAATSQKPLGAVNLGGIVSGPQGWSVWAKRENHDHNVIIALFNDMDQGAELIEPVAFAAGAEITISIPLNPQAERASVTVPYMYMHGTEAGDKIFDGKLELKGGDKDFNPDVRLKVNHNTPSMIPGGTLVTISWIIKDGVSATLRGPLPGGNSELVLSSDPRADFKIAGGALEVRVVGAMTYVLQAEVKRGNSQPDVVVTRVLSLDVANNKYTYLNSRTVTVLPNGLIEIDWAAWGVKQVKIDVTGHTTRVVRLTQQTIGRFFEGTGVMRVSARKSMENITLDAQPALDKPKQRTVTVVSWEKMLKPDLPNELALLSMAVIAPKLAVLSSFGLHIADVGQFDSESAMQKLMFVKPPDPRTVTEYYALAAVEKRFVLLSRTGMNAEVAAFTIDGKLEEIPPVTLPLEVLGLIAMHGALDFVGFGKRVYLAVEGRPTDLRFRRAVSIGFDSNTKKADVRHEPLLEAMLGYSLVTFDGGLYALSRETGRMLRFNLTNGMLDKPLEAASAVKKNESSNKDESMVTEGLLVPVGRVLVVMNPTSYPSIAALEDQGLKNTLPYENTRTPGGDPNRIPQDLVYNPQKNFWARCGHDLEVNPDTIAAFRDGDSPRLWAIQPNREAYTLAVGSESLFAPNYVFEVQSKPLPPHFNKKRQFTIKFADMRLSRISSEYNVHGLFDFAASGPVELLTALPTQPVTAFTFELSYNETHVNPVTFRFQMAHQPQWRPEINYVIEVTFSGPNLSTATSSFKRVRLIPNREFSYQDVTGSSVQYSTENPIEVKPAGRFTEQFKMMIVNASNQFRIKPKTLRDIDFILDQALITVNHDLPDFTLAYDGKVATEGEVSVNFNFAMPNGIEASSATVRQTKLIRIGNNNTKKIEILLVKMLMPGDPALTLKGATAPIVAKDGPLFVCHLDYKP